MSLKRYDGMSLNELIKEMSNIKSRLDDVSAEKTLLQKQFDVLRHQYVPEAMIDQDVSTIKIEGVGRVHLTSDLKISIKAARRQDAYQWLMENGYGDLITDTVNASTLKAAAKGWIERGDVNVPTDLFNYHPMTSAGWTRVK